MQLEQVNYEVLDKAKLAFIDASKKTLRFAERYGFVPDEKLGASANVFALDLKPFLAQRAEKLFITLIPEGLGTADDARPNDLTPKELEVFWHNVGLKTMGALTNDAASGGMQTILISLYLPSSTPERVFDQSFLNGFLEGFVSGCKTVGCVWISGETPQLKGKICQDKLDVAGALFGLMPPGITPIDGANLRAGNKIVFLASSGPHENGFTTLRKIAEDLPAGYRTKLPDGTEFWQAINAPSVLYTPFIQDLLKAKVAVTGIENITGHGWQKLMRSKKPLRYVIEQMLPVPPVFQFVEKVTGMDRSAMLKIFNCGVGMAVYLDNQPNAQEAIKIAEKHGLDAIIAGEIVEAPRREIAIEPLSIRLDDKTFGLGKD
ncbi:MAG: phosphoribosylformylglycinamidine cyclo-ligase [Candidatus Melainabacteria bacterium]|nr:MAG: phosphoribosylformylglycinamidine cyclo-ligase [Candidatus Melainabacteria bacterium]